MSVRAKLSLFENFPSVQETDLLDRSIEKIKDPETDVSTESPRRGDNPFNGEPSNLSTKDMLMTNQIVDEELLDTPMSESQNTATALANQSQNSLSYRDKLMGKENPVTLSFNTIPSYMEEESDIDDDPEDDTPIVLLSRAEKRRIREPWMNAIIIKAFHPKPLGYNYVFPRVQAQWKPNGKWDFIDLGFDFFLVRFQDNEDLSKVIMGGPWFIGPYYLTIRRWEPNFDPEEAIRTTTTTAVWARLPNLSADYYDPITLQKIGNKIGSLLRVDAHTAHHTRGQYARVCVQIDIAQPVAKYIRIGRKKQRVIYEGVSALCFHCGRIGHRNNQCLQLNITSEIINEAANTATLPTHASNSTFPNDYGPWLLVERCRAKRKPPSNSSALEKTPANPKAKDVRDSGNSTRNTSPKTQRVTNNSLSNQQNGNVLNAINVDQSSKQGPTVHKAKTPLVDYSKPEPKTHLWVSKTSAKVQGPPMSTSIQEPKYKPKSSHTQGQPSHQANIPEPNFRSDIHRLSVPQQDPSSYSPNSIQPTHPTPDHFTSTSTFGTHPQSQSPQTSSSPLPSHGSAPVSETCSENTDVSCREPANRPDGDSCGVDAGLHIPQGFQMVVESIVHSVENSHSHQHGGEPPRDSPFDPPSRGKSKFKRVMSDRESRIDRRRQSARRGVEPYQATSFDKLCLPKPPEDRPTRGENGTHSSSTENPVVLRDPHREGLPNPFPTISFSPSQVPLMDISIPTAGVQSVESPDSIGAINHS
ncbi:hypothetical protein SLEP1_g37492 [Rubroshorea leprosula]|uniref:CCHC-type domain-containing protein n=1 Tax=Rubroshorea leprosula TaxID=152421 RepID=A0AAV5KVM2_9ROSI|nr:hypothetical protein SLEP1_g37492 [Rubroshorea leprosula]